MIFIGLFHSISYFISERDYSIFYEELQRLFGDGSDEKIWLIALQIHFLFIYFIFCLFFHNNFKIYQISGFKSLGKGLGYVSPSRVSASSFLASSTSFGVCKKSIAVRAMILAA